MQDKGPADIEIQHEGPADIEIQRERPADTGIQYERPADIEIQREKPTDIKIQHERTADAVTQHEKSAAWYGPGQAIVVPEDFEKAESACRVPEIPHKQTALVRAPKIDGGFFQGTAALVIGVICGTGRIDFRHHGMACAAQCLQGDYGPGGIRFVFRGKLGS